VADPPVVIGARMPPPGAETGIRTVVVMGSSTAEGAGPAHSDSTWANRLRATLRATAPDLRLLNIARGGYSSYQLLPTGTPVPAGRPAPDATHNVTAALARQPVAVVLNLPSNDAASGFTVAEQQANFETIVAAFEAAGVPVWVTTTQPRNFDRPEQVADQQAVRDWILQRFGDRAIDVWTGLATADGRVDPRWDSGDGVHLNDAAHGLFFRRLLRTDLLDTLAETP
jgi:lysophospholipase L1-like esterase